jgi:hypothetical protein
LNEAVDNNYGVAKDDMSVVVCKFLDKWDTWDGAKTSHFFVEFCCPIFRLLKSVRIYDIVIP